MKSLNFFILLISILINACDQISNNIIDQEFINITVESINTPNEFYYSPVDSTFFTSIKILNSNVIDKIWIKIKFNDGSIVHQQIMMSDEGDYNLTGDQTRGDGIYTAKISMSKNNASGYYIIEYYFQPKKNYSYESVLKIASHKFYYVNSQINYPPEIIELLIPNTVFIEERITLKVKVIDKNGLSDIASVYYELYKPDGTKTVNTQGISQFPLFDDGNKNNNGDEVANDGIYSVYLTFPRGQPSGQWRFEFYAKDRSGTISEKAVHYITVK